MLILLETMALENRQAPAALDALLGRLAQGDQEALGILYDRTRTAVYGLALGYLKSQADAEDVTQDTFVRAWEHAPDYRPQGRPLAWLLAICRNLCRMRLRQGERNGVLSDEAWDALPALPSGLPPEDRVVLSAALMVLEDEERRIVLLHAVTGLKHREIAELLELPLSTTLSKYHRALKKLRKSLEGGNAQ